MDYKALYNQKLTTAAAIAAQVQDNWTLSMDSGVAQTPAIMAAIADRAKTEGLRGVKVHCMLEVFPFEFFADNMLLGKMTGVSWFASSAARNAVNGGFAEYIPSYYRDMPGHIRRNYEVDAYCVSVSPMDKHGYFSLATVASNSEALLEKAKHIYVEVNKNQPRAVRGLQLHVSQIDALIENDIELPVLPEAKIDKVSETIGGIIAEQICDGACIQLGIGAIPDATGLALKTKHDLGIHTEMFTGSMVELINCGAVNNSKKQIHRGKSVTTFAYGSKSIYDYIDDNPAIEFLPVDYVNNPEVISKNDNFVSINAALEVDLWGQVCAESVGTKLMSGTGGQVDFVRGACQSKGGKSFIAFASTAKGGTISKIKPILTPGAIVTTSKNDVDHIVTEYGIANLRGKSLSERAKQLIAIAHPDFRDELEFDAKKRGLLI